MKKIFFVLIISVVSTITAKSQTTWSYSSSYGLYYNVSGKKVGIGTSTPQRPLHVEGTTRFSFGSAGGDCLLELLNWNLTGGQNDVTISASNLANSAHAPLVFAGSKFYFHSGNVGIGTSDTKGYKLAVAGSMVAEQVVVKLKSTWPDYVFKKDYELMPLNQVEEFISTNNHLPGIPSAQQVGTEGVNLLEMNIKLLQKVEELTLYIINQQKEIENLKSLNN